MRAVDLIQKKRDGQELTSSEIEWLIEGYVSGTVPDYQMSAFAMAVYFKGMTTREISDLVSWDVILPYLNLYVNVYILLIHRSTLHFQQYLLLSRLYHNAQVCLFEVIYPLF